MLANPVMALGTAKRSPAAPLDRRGRGVERCGMEVPLILPAVGIAVRSLPALALSSIALGWVRCRLVVVPAR